VDTIGLGFATNGVSVNGDGSAYRHGEYFCYPMSLNNSSAAQWQSVSVTASGQSNVTGHVFVSQTPETFGYDADGNMTNDGRWFLGWDAQNRLTKAESLASSPTASKRKVTWEFSPDGRRIRQTTYDGSSGSYLVTEDLKFVNDGWRCIAELNATNNALVRSYTWGLDLSGTMDGAGGIGGLLFVSDQSTISNQPSTHCVAFDGNGNVAALVSATDGTVTAAYEYEPVGRALRSTGPMAKANPFRFSTKRASEATDLVLYEMRVYSASRGDFISQDPAGELGGENLYCLAKNNSSSQIDALGLDADPTDIMWQKLDQARADISGPNLLPGEMVMTTGFPGVLGIFGGLGDGSVAGTKAKAVYGDPGVGNAAIWKQTIHSMVIRQNASLAVDTVVHEMTHAYQDLVLHYDMGKYGNVGERNDEGEAYAIETFYVISKHLAGSRGEAGIRRAGCNRAAVAGIWKGFWRRYGVLPGAWLPVKWSGNPRPGTPMTAADLARTYRILGARLSCRALRDAVNEILGGAGCTFTVDCCASDFPNEIGTAVQIEPIFQ
jgi:RHS repeat-associated protein